MKNQLDSYIEATTKSSDRSRFILIVVVVVSVVTFVSWWNTRDDNWVVSRLVLAKTILSLEKGNQVADRDLARRAAEYKALADPSQESLQETVTESRKAWLAQNQIKIPLFDVIVELNDIGLLSGFSYVMILIWFVYSSQRELNGLRTTFDQASAEKVLAQTFHVLGMWQVLTVPSLADKKMNQLLNRLPALLLVLPFLVQLLVFVSDVRSYPTGLLLSPSRARIILVFGACWIVAIVALSISSILLFEKRVQVWERVAQQLVKEAAL